MDNDILINQARHLYATLQVKQQAGSSDRLNRLVRSAYFRYQRRLNRCVVCYQTRLVDCDRYILEKFCPHKSSEPYSRESQYGN